MHARIITTITTLIDLDTLKPESSVDISPDEELPRVITVAAVSGALKATLRSLEADEIKEYEA